MRINHHSLLSLSADHQCLDPAIEETKKVCVNLRKNSRDERTLFYYNGHGVPKPTNGGEIWVFNKSAYSSLLIC